MCVCVCISDCRILCIVDNKVVTGAMNKMRIKNEQEKSERGRNIQNYARWENRLVKRGTSSSYTLTRFDVSLAQFTAFPDIVCISPREALSVKHTRKHAGEQTRRHDTV